MVIDDIPGVLESAVIGVPHPDFGEAVVAVVVATTAGKSTLTEQSISAVTKAQLANFKNPKKVILVDDLPATPWARCRRIFCVKSTKLCSADPGRGFHAPAWELQGLA